jgi:hypothetical protein
MDASQIEVTNQLVLNPESSVEQCSKNQLKRKRREEYLKVKKQDKKAAEKKKKNEKKAIVKAEKALLHAEEDSKQPVLENGDEETNAH